MFRGKSATRGPLAIAVPGELAAYKEGHKLMGKLKWSELFTGAIKMANDGFESEILQKIINDVFLFRYPAMSKVFGNMKRGSKFIQRPDLAKTLQTIADEGPESFYGG